MDELLGFAHARLDEDEQTAQACAGAPWAIEVPPMLHVSVKARQESKWKWGKLGYVATVERDEDRAHIARHDPARTLRDVQARRKTLLRCQEEMLSGIPRLVHFARMTVWEMSQRWNDHELFNEGWKP
ncbi:DUF6221 family protein [[Actinomadura] parvosata]|uniref:DUF6221 family protein n=1 Tax=[Actinomadura] parvosata TaxID=1955412 RepID=UPI00406CDFF0